MSWLFHAFANTPPGRVFLYVMWVVWGVLFLFITAKLALQHAWGYAALTAAFAVLLVRRVVLATRVMLARRRAPQQLSGRAPDSPRR